MLSCHRNIARNIDDIVDLPVSRICFGAAVTTVGFETGNSEKNGVESPTEGGWSDAGGMIMSALSKGLT